MYLQNIPMKSFPKIYPIFHLIWVFSLAFLLVNCNNQNTTGTTSQDSLRFKNAAKNDGLSN